MFRSLYRGGLYLSILTALSLVRASDLEDPYPLPIDHPAIGYSDAPTHDAVSGLIDRIEKGKAKLDYHSRQWSYLPSLLLRLGINVDSQILVFSKTSFHPDLVSRTTPRAIYFNDTTSVAIVPNNDVLEISSLDPKQGIIFYTLATRKTSQPDFVRRGPECLTCHCGAQTLDVPGRLISSLYAPGVRDARGLHGLSSVTDQRVPLSERWGGWYVSGKLGFQKHRGTRLGEDPTAPPQDSRAQEENAIDHDIITTVYPASTSDVVALMTFEHQSRMTNLLTRIGWETRIAIADKTLDSFLPELNSHIEELVSYMVFANEAPLAGPIEGASSFGKTFPERGPRDNQGRSLRDFDLKKRLFRYPISYMIYSDAFDNIPATARDRIYQRLYDVLSGRDTSSKFSGLSIEDRRAALEIVRLTKQNLPSYWKDQSAVR